MSSSSIIDWTGNGKIFNSLLPNPYPYPAQANDLAQVLIAGQDAGNQDIINLNQLEVTNIVQQAAIGGHLSVGAPGGDLRIEGGTALGSMLAGNGTSTTELPLGTNGYVLTADSAQVVGVKWAAAGGAGVASITAGSNIGVNNAIPAAPVVSLLAPLTSTLNMGAVAITDSAGAVGVSGQVLTAGTGGQTLWGTNGVSSITAGTNISVTGTASVPIVNLQNPLTATLNVGTQNVQGTTTQITLTNGGSQAVQQATTGFTSIDSTTPTTKANLFKTSITIETTTNKVDIRPTQIVKTGSSTFTIQNNTAPLSLSGNNAGNDGVVIQQSVNVGTALTTSLSNVKYYPDYYLSNNNASSVAVPLPQVDYQRLTLNNLGLTNTNSWNDYGSAIFSPSGYEAFFIDSNSNVWLAETGTGNIRVCDNPPVNILHNITMANSAGAPVAVNVFYEQGGYVFIGGTFDSINGNATPQYNITRVSSTTYMEELMGDSAANVFGTGANYIVHGMTDVNGALAFCGTFTSLSNGAPASYICEIASPYVAGLNQTYSEMLGGVNSVVYAVFYNSNRVFFGGDFTAVDNSSPIGYAYAAYYDYNVSSWLDVALNTLNGSVYIIKPTAYGYIFLGGNFTSPQTSPYSCYIEEATPQNTADTSLVLSTAPTYKHAYGAGATLSVYSSGTQILWVSSNFQVWVNLGQPSGSGSDVTGVNFWSGNYKVIYNNYEFVRSHATLPHSCIFTGSFIYDAVVYGNYTLTTRNVSQQFIGDDNNSYWSLIGFNIGTFS